MPAAAFISIHAAQLTLVGILGLALFDPAASQSLGDSRATTESSCNFGMAKGEGQRSCQVPFLHGCVVANFPGASRPWSSISKGGATTCRFDATRTDWTSRITGACEPCKSEHCSARFGVMFDCSSHLPPPGSQPPSKTNP